MKKRFTFLILFFSVSSLWAQQSVRLSLDHRLDQAFFFEQYSLQKLIGSRALITFFKPECTPCRKQLEALSCVQEKQPSYQVISIGIQGSREEIRNEVRPLSLSYPILIAHAKLREELQAIQTTPLTLILEKDGSLIKSFSRFSDCKELLESIQSVSSP